ncbi:MAG: thioesterase family protein [Thermoplasmata archaeon]|jgi:acyl-CoA thioester hydrolase|nr:thioesterase family protein [Thermoplasmata archaeon]
MVTETPRFEQSFRVGWGDIDGNGHMGNTAFLDRASDTRVRFFALHGLSVARFAAEHFGPVIVRDELVYRKELRLLDEFTVDLELVGVSGDGLRFQLSNTFRTAAGEVAAEVTSEGVWFDLEQRRPRAPPPEVDAVQREMRRGERFHEIPSRSSTRRD